MTSGSQPLAASNSSNGLQETRPRPLPIATQVICRVCVKPSHARLPGRKPRRISREDEVFDIRVLDELEWRRAAQAQRKHSLRRRKEYCVYQLLDENQKLIYAMIEICAVLRRHSARAWLFKGMHRIHQQNITRSMISYLTSCSSSCRKN